VLKRLGVIREHGVAPGNEFLADAGQQKSLKLKLQFLLDQAIDLPVSTYFVGYPLVI
jgi:hypothetical protein